MLMRRLLACLLFCLAVALQAMAQSSVRLEGQVVCCADCWAEADRIKVEFGTAEDLLKAKSCVEGRDPTLLVVRRDNAFTFYELEQGKFKLPQKNWLEFIGKRVNVSGEVRERKGKNILRVHALEITAPSLAERDAANVLGQEVEMTLRDLSGIEQRLSSLKGRLVILNFWATYCIPCRKEMPDLTLVQNDYAALGVQVIGASTDEAADRPKVLQFVKETKLNFPIWMGASVADMVRFGLGSALPGTVLINKDGKIAKVISGPINPAAVRKQIDAMLASTETVASLKKNKLPSSTTAADSHAHEVSSVPS